ncbi:MAG: 7-carboxy-7-deazaguanine synthase QueE [Planctomycetota bacterium]
MTSLQVAAPVLEVFASIQGEGRYVGEPQVFLRLAGCPLRCAWCDTPGSWTVRPGGTARVTRVLDDGSSSVLREDPWVSPFQAAVWVAGAEPGEPRTVSVTGGEPLLWPEFLRGLRPMLGQRRLHLETGGGHPETLARVLEAFDHVSLDLKLPQDMGAPVELDPAAILPAADHQPPTTEPAPRDAADWTVARRRALVLVADHDACVKVVVAGARTPRDFEPLLEDVARLAPKLPLFLAPATPMHGVEAPEFDTVIEVAELARELGLMTRVLPQVHRLLRIP